jgi:hypothetical protein
MTRAARQAHEWLTVIAGAGAALIWAAGASLAGGLNLGVAFMISDESRRAAYRPGASR